MSKFYQMLKEERTPILTISEKRGGRNTSQSVLWALTDTKIWQGHYKEKNIIVSHEPKHKISFKILEVHKNDTTLWPKWMCSQFKGDQDLRINIIHHILEKRRK